MRYIADTVLRILGLALAIFTALIAVFGIEKLAWLIDIALRFRVGLGNFATLYLTFLPDVADFILPIALVVGCYTIVLQKREAREYLVWASAGDGHRMVVLTVWAVGLIGALLCLWLSGFVKPAASLVFRQTYVQAMADAVSTGLPGGKFYTQPGSVLFVASASAPNATQMRVFNFDGERLKRLTVSNCASLRAFGGQVLSQLCDARVYLFGLEAQSPATASSGGGQEKPVGAGPCRLCADAQGGLDIVRVEAGRSSIAFPMDSVFAGVPDLRTKDRSITQLLAISDGEFLDAGDARRAATYVLLSITCILSVAAALAAVALTAGRMGVLALCGAIGAVIGAIVLVRSEVLLVWPIRDPTWLMGVAAGGAILSLGAIALVAVAFHTRLITPMFVRS